MTDFDTALEEAIRTTGIGRYRHLCSDANTLPAPNDRETWRQFIREGRWRRDQSYPSLAMQAGNVLGAAGRAVGAAVRGEVMVVDRAEMERRLSICRVCEFFDAERVRCRKCGCYLSLKLRLATDHCPIDKW